MAVPKHLNEAVTRLNLALAQIDAARVKPVTLETLQEWLAALTDYAGAQSDIQAFNNESIHEKIHAVAGRLGVGDFPPVGRVTGAQHSGPKRHGRT